MGLAAVVDVGSGVVDAFMVVEKQVDKRIMVSTDSVVFFIANGFSEKIVHKGHRNPICNCYTTLPDTYMIHRFLCF